MSSVPIRIRLTLSFGVAMAVVLAVVGLFVYKRVGNELLGTVNASLVAQSREEIQQRQCRHRRGQRPDLCATVRSERTAAQVATTESATARRAAGRRARRLPASESGSTRSSRIGAASGASSRWRRRPEGVAVLARSLEARDESLDHLRHELLIFLPLALLAASLGGYALTARALAPVELLRRRAESVNPGEPSRLPVPPAGDEISRLAQTLNEMLARLQAAVEHERRFVADASHELRTPLALLRTELDLALRRPRSREELESALRSAADETQRLSRLAEDLLLIARADQGPLPIRQETVAVDDLLADAATRFASRASALGRELRVSESGLHVDADPLRAGQALVNLVDNALTHGAGTVELRAEERGVFVELHVSDEGSGFPPGFREPRLRPLQPCRRGA